MDDIACDTSQPAADDTLDRRVLGEFRDADTNALPEFALMLIEQFVQEAECQVALLRDAAGGGDAPVMKSAAHCLKGSSLTMGATRLGALCAQMEVQAAGGASVATSELMVSIDQEFIKVRNALAAER